MMASYLRQHAKLEKKNSGEGYVYKGFFWRGYILILGWGRNGVLYENISGRYNGLHFLL